MDSVWTPCGLYMDLFEEESPTPRIVRGIPRNVRGHSVRQISFYSPKIHFWKKSTESPRNSTEFHGVHGLRTERWGTVKYWQMRTPMESATQFGEYYHDFTQISHYLKEQGRLNDTAISDKFIGSVDPAFRHCLRLQLHVEDPTHHPDDAL